MRGIVYTGDDAEVTDELGIRDPGPNEVRVQIGAAGVCHSDLSVINGTIPWKAPSVLGHEGAFHGMVPLMTERSLWHTPAAPTATRTSVGPGLPRLNWSVTSTSSPV